MARFNYFFCFLGMFFCQICLVKLQTYSCENVVKLSGNLSHVYTVRGGPSLYHRCWIIQNPEKNVVFIQLNSISLQNGGASGGVLSIKFVSESKVFNVFSPSQLRNLTTTSPTIEIHFKVNSLYFGSGMVAGFGLYFHQDCDRILTDLTGNLSSPGYPNTSLERAECTYKIRLGPGYLINITFHNVQIGYREDCAADSLEIRDGDNEESTLISDLCGSIASYSLMSTNNNLWLKFKAVFYLGQRFYAHYSAVKIVHDDCNPEDSFRCANNTCIPKSQFCDGMINCENGADEHECEILVEVPSTMDSLKEVSDAINDNSTKNLKTSFTDDKLESGTKTHEFHQCANGTTELVKKDVLNMEVKVHRRRLEVIELQKKYEMDRIEFQRSFETERLKQMKQYHNLKIRVASRGLDKDNNEEESQTKIIDI